MITQVRLLPALALAASAAAAQTAPVVLDIQTGAGALESPAAATWNAAISQAFFTDETTMTLLPEADARAKWSALSPETQRLVRRDCKAARAGSIGGATGQKAGPPDAAAGSPEDPLPPMLPDATAPAGSAVAAGDISLSHLVKICSLVDGI